MGQIFISKNNSTKIALAANTSFIGQTDILTSFQELDINVFGAPLIAPADLYFEFSPDGYYWDVSVPLPLAGPSIPPIILRTVLPYFRIRYLNGAINLTELRITTVLHRDTAIRLTRFLSQDIDLNEPIEVIRVAKSILPDGAATEATLAALSGRNPETTRDLNNEQVGFLGANGVFTGIFTKVSSYKGLTFLYASTVPYTAQIEWSSDGIVTDPGIAGIQVLAVTFINGFYVSLLQTSIPLNTYYRVRITNGGTLQTNVIVLAILQNNPINASIGRLDAQLNILSQSLLTRAVVAGINPDGYFENVNLDLDNALQVSSRQILDSDNTVTITSSSLAGQIPGNPFLGTPFHTRNRNIQENLTTIVAFNNSGPLNDLGGQFHFKYWSDVGGVPIGPDIDQLLTINSFSTVRTPGWLSNAGDYYSVSFEPNRPLVSGETVVIQTTHSKLTGNDYKRLPEQVLEEGSQTTTIVSSFLKAYGTDGNSHNIRSTPDEALRISDDKIYETPSGSIFVESIRDDISHKFTSTDGYAEIATLRNFSVGGTVSLDTDNGQAVFSTGSAPGSSAVFFSNKKAVYETGHGLIGEQTIVLLSYPIGDGYAEIGFASDDLANGTGFGMDSVGIYTWRRKNSIYEQKTYSFSWNRDKCDGNIPSLFKFNNAPQSLSAIKNNLYRVHYEWFGAAAHKYFIKPPAGGILEVHAEEYPNQYIGSSLPNPQLSLHIAVFNDTTTGGDLVVHSGSWRGGIFTSKNIQTGQTPNGDFSDIKVQGRDSDNSTDTPLVANDIFRGKWFEWQVSYLGVIVDMKSDVSGVLYVDLSQQISPVDGDDSSVDNILPSNNGSFYDPILEPLLIREFPLQSRWIRLRYINGQAAQSIFSLYTAFITSSPNSRLQPIKIEPLENDLAILSHSVLVAKNNTTSLFNTLTSTMNITGKKGLDVNVTKIEDDLLLRPMETVRTSQALVGVDPVQVAFPALTNRRSIAISNDGRTTTPSRVFYGTSGSVTALPGSNAGFCIPVGRAMTIRAGSTVDTWLISENTGGSTQTDTVVGTITSGTATNPGNVLSSNNVYANITAAGQTIILSGFSLTGTLSDIQSVKIFVEANKTASQFEQVSHIATVTGNAGNVGSVSTSSNVISVSTNFYLAAISREANSTVNTVAGLGLTWVQVLSVPSDDSHRRLDVWRGTGTPTGDSVVAASFSIVSVNSHIAVSRYSNVDLTSPIVASNSAVANSTAPSVSVASSNAKGLAYGASAHDNNTFTQGAGFTLRSEEVTAAGANRDGLATETKELASGGAQTINGTLSGGTHWVIIGITLNPIAAIDDVITVSYKLSGNAGATTGNQTYSSSTDSQQSLDITADRAWVFSNISNVEVTITGTTIGAAALNVDQIFLQVVESSANTSLVSILEVAE